MSIAETSRVEAAPSDAELIQRARDLAPGIQARAAEADKRRKPHDDSIKELIDAGIVQMFVPKKWGGSEASLSTMQEVVSIISAACPSTGWIAAFYIVHNIYIGKYPKRTQEELYGKNGYVLLPAATAPNLSASKVDGGWEVSGRALWGSGVMHADWVMMSGMTDLGQRSFLMPVGDVDVQDNWHFIGMSGTGSNDYVADKVFVPDHLSLDMDEVFAGPTEGSRLHENPLYSVPLLMLAYCTFYPVITGSLTGALRAYEAIVDKRVRNFSGSVVKDQQNTQILLGNFQVATQVANELARAAFERTEKIMHSRPFTVEDRLYAKGQTAFTSNHCRDTVNKMMSVAGSSNFHTDQPLQRIWRDLNMVCSHAFVDWDITREQFGRQYLDLPFTHPLI
ncbi:acyl-CoA dehydrogenase family protein [Henriciella aquimarina]|uniref:acyl-CoA dehydrogenase family protein n=1 Tax=Henriciella aquimarina TaxID=545261 RepID=UPI000A06958E|nr:acyl-CoA dehydrogenase family protein [Henriciella aquimarina]